MAETVEETVKRAPEHVGMIRDFKPRLYQETILATAALHNTLVVLPTGMGKTFIFLMLAAQRLSQYPDSKILFLGPTRPLIDQYFSVFSKHFGVDPDKMVVFTGNTPPEKRAALWETAKIIFSTPQALENDIISRRVDLSGVSLLGVDEAHRGVGNYAYVWITKQYMKHARYPRVLALTASPGSTTEKIKEVCANLSIEEIEVRTDDDPDVKQYVQEVDVDWVEVNLPESFSKIQKFLRDCVASKMKDIKDQGLQTPSRQPSRTDMLQLQRDIQARLASGERDFSLMRASSLLAEAMKASHAVELLESQGIIPLYQYLTKLQSQSRTSKVKAVQNLVRDLNFKSALILTEKLVEQEVEHPKMGRLREIVKDSIDVSDGRCMVFTQYRDTASHIVDNLNALDGVNACLFVGQTKRGTTGLSQKQQKQMIGDFASGEFNVLVATSIGEEGLDIPKVDLVVFYEPVPSAIRSIQRRGRTGRLEGGRVVVLIAKGTRDVSIRWVAHRKEKRMHTVLQKLKREFRTTKPAQTQPTLDQYSKQMGEGLKIFADYREKDSKPVRTLIDEGVHLELAQLTSADFVVSSRVGIELKTVPDFVDSLVDGRLLEQLKQLKARFEQPLVIVEGTEDIYAMRKVHPNAIRGMYSTIAASYGIPIIFSRNPDETTAFLLLIARREQRDGPSNFSPHGSKKPSSLREAQEYIVSALPGVGSSLAREMLNTFGSVEKIMAASQEELKAVDLIGEKKAGAIRRALDSPYERWEKKR